MVVYLGSRVPCFWVWSPLKSTEEVVTSMFADVQSHWAKGDIEFLASLGLVKGDEAGRFRPDAPITRAETAVLLSRTIRLLQGGRS